MMKNEITIPHGVSKTFFEEKKFSEVKIVMDETAILPISVIRSAKNLKYIVNTSTIIVNIPDNYFPNDNGENYHGLERIITADELCIKGEIIGKLSLEYC